MGCHASKSSAAAPVAAPVAVPDVAPILVQAQPRSYATLLRSRTAALARDQKDAQDPEEEQRQADRFARELGAEPEGMHTHDVFFAPPLTGLEAIAAADILVSEAAAMTPVAVKVPLHSEIEDIGDAGRQVQCYPFQCCAAGQR